MDLKKQFLLVLFVFTFPFVAFASPVCSENSECTFRELKVTCEGLVDKKDTLEFRFEGKIDYSLFLLHDGERERNYTGLTEIPTDDFQNLFKSSEISFEFHTIAPIDADSWMRGVVTWPNREVREYSCEVPKQPRLEDYAGIWKLESGRNKDIEIEYKRKKLKITTWKPGSSEHGKIFQHLNRHLLRGVIFSSVTDSGILVLETYKKGNAIFTYQKRYFMSPDHQKLYFKMYFISDETENFSRREDPYECSSWKRVD